MVALYVGVELLLVRASYRIAWSFPGGGIRRRETPEAAARRELAEETGIIAHELVTAGSVSGTWDGQRDLVHVFELRLDRLPALRIDNREIVAARLIAPEALPGMAVTGPVAAYLRRVQVPAGSDRGVTPSNCRRG